MRILLAVFLDFWQISGTSGRKTRQHAPLFSRLVWKLRTFTRSCFPSAKPRVRDLQFRQQYTSDLPSLRFSPHHQGCSPIHSPFGKQIAGYSDHLLVYLSRFLDLQSVHYSIISTDKLCRPAFRTAPSTPLSTIIARRATWSFLTHPSQVSRHYSQ